MKDPRMELIQQQILKFTQMDFSMSVPISGKGDDLDAIIVGLNTLGEELAGSGVISKDEKNK